MNKRTAYPAVNAFVRVANTLMNAEGEWPFTFGWNGRFSPEPYYTQTNQWPIPIALCMRREDLSIFLPPELVFDLSDLLNVQGCIVRLNKLKNTYPNGIVSNASVTSKDPVALYAHVVGNWLASRVGGSILDYSQLSSSIHGKAIAPYWPDSKINRDPCFPSSVVLIEDNEVYREEIKIRLEEVFSSVIEFSSPGKYFDSIKGNGYQNQLSAVDVFFVDIVDESKAAAGVLSLPGLLQLLPAIRQYRGLKRYPMVIMLSSMADHLAADLCYRLGADYYLNKSTFLLYPNLENLLSRVIIHSLKSASLVMDDYKKEWSHKESDKDKGWERLQKDLENKFAQKSPPVIDPKNAAEEKTLEVKSIVRALYSQLYHVDHIDFIKRMGGGLSSAMTIVVQFSVVGDQMPQPPRIVKIDACDKVAHEWTACHNLVAPILNQHYAQIEPFYFMGANTGALSYRLAGTETAFRLNLIAVPEDILLDGQSIALEICERLFTQALRPLHSHACEIDLPEPYLLSYMAPELAAIEVQIDEDAQNKCAIVEINTDDLGSAEALILQSAIEPFPCMAIDPPGELDSCLIHQGKQLRISNGKGDEDRSHHMANMTIDILKKHYEDGIPGLRSAFVRHIESEGKLAGFIKYLISIAKEMDMPPIWGIVHGDFNLKNAVLNHEDNSLWLIDFAKTSCGPPAIDFVAFEYELRFQILTPILSDIMERQECRSTDKNIHYGWISSVQSVVDAFEGLTQNEHRIDMESLGLLEKTSTITRELMRKHKSQIRLAWQAIIKTRQLAFEMYYRTSILKKEYDLLFSLFALRAIQKYKKEWENPKGPVGTLWAYRAMSTACSRLAKK